jgi:hypothetical protein
MLWVVGCGLWVVGCGLYVVGFLLHDGKVPGVKIKQALLFSSFFYPFFDFNSMK